MEHHIQENLYLHIGKLHHNFDTTIDTRDSNQKIKSKSRVATDSSINDYINDPYFVKKREIGAAFLKKVGLPESYKKSQNK